MQKKTFVPIALLGLTLVLATRVFAQGSPPPPPAPPPLMFSSQAVQYRCDGGAEIELVYLNLANGNAFAALHHEGRTVMLQGRRATTGVRFVAWRRRAQRQAAASSPLRTAPSSVAG